MHGAQAVNADPGVTLRGLQPGVTEHLDASDVGPAFEHESRHGMTKEVTAPSFLNTGSSAVEAQPKQAPLADGYIAVLCPFCCSGRTRCLGVVDVPAGKLVSKND